MAYKLFIQTDLGAYIHLDGASIAVPVKGARYSPGLGRRRNEAADLELITEEVVVELAGTYRQISDWVAVLLQDIELLRAGAWRKPDFFRPCLCVQEQDATEGYVWRSAIVSMAVALDAAGLAQRRLGRQLVTLSITREHRWVYSQSAGLAMTLPDGTVYTTQGYVLNHHDSTAGHSNWGVVPTANVTGSLPSDDYLMVETQQAGRSLGDLYIGCGWMDAGPPNVLTYLPTLQETAFTPGAGVTKTGYASAACAGGNYAGFAWAAAGEVVIGTADIPTWLYENNLSNGRPFKPMGRLQAGLAAADLWLKARIQLSTVGTVVYETEWVLYPSGSQLIELPPVFIPPAGVWEGTGLVFALVAMRASSTSYTLNLDYFQLWPVDGGFRKLKPTSYVTGTGRVIDDGPMDRSYWISLLGVKRGVYYGLGERLRLMPGRVNVLAIINITGGTSWLIDDQIYFTVAASPVKRDL